LPIHCREQQAGLTANNAETQSRIRIGMFFINSALIWDVKLSTECPTHRGFSMNGIPVPPEFVPDSIRFSVPAAQMLHSLFVTPSKETCG
jgi:hypothetical protein